MLSHKTDCHDFILAVRGALATPTAVTPATVKPDGEQLQQQQQGSPTRLKSPGQAASPVKVAGVSPLKVQCALSSVIFKTADLSYIFEQVLDSKTKIPNIYFFNLPYVLQISDFMFSC